MKKNNIKNYLKEKKVNEVILMADPYDEAKDLLKKAMKDKKVLMMVAKDVEKYIEDSGILEGPNLEDSVSNAFFNYVSSHNGDILDSAEFNEAYTDVVFDFVVSLGNEILNTVPREVAAAAKRIK